MRRFALMQDILHLASCTYPCLVDRIQTFRVLSTSRKMQYHPTWNFWHHSLPWFTALHFLLSLQRLFDLVN